MKITRRDLLGSASAAWAATAFTKAASAAAEFEFKLGVNTPDTHPLTLRLIEAAKAIGAQSSGRLNVTVFSNSQLGGDPEMLSQVRAGGIELLAAPSMTLSILVPLSGLPSIGFAFRSNRAGAGLRAGKPGIGGRPACSSRLTPRRATSASRFMRIGFAPNRPGTPAAGSRR